MVVAADIEIRRNQIWISNFADAVEICIRHVYKSRMRPGESTVAVKYRRSGSCVGIPEKILRAHYHPKHQPRGH